MSWDSNMSLTSLNYFLFLTLVLTLYYIFKPIQKYILLGFSIVFYLLISISFGRKRLLLLIVFYWGIAYLGGILIQKYTDFKKKLILWGGILSILGILFTLKYAFNLYCIVEELFKFRGDVSLLKFAPIIGISYYSLSAIGYLIDVYWGTIKAERNCIVVGLFIFFFPQLISGPITRYSAMKPYFTKLHNLKYDSISMGLRRMIYGYLKKLVISERFAVVVSFVFGNAKEYSGIGIIAGSFCYAIQLYTDFSGCMDIIMGTALLFGIKLPENFNAPFFSETIQEFWQRWHITLGQWYKDYVMYPLQKTKFIQDFGKKGKRIVGKKYGKKIPFHLSMLVLWILIGIWHGGTSYYFIASAFIPGILLFCSDLCQDIFIKLRNNLHINYDCVSWHWVRRIRTQFLLLFCWIFVNAGSTRQGIKIIARIVNNPYAYSSFSDAISKIGLTSLDALLMSWAIVVLYVEQKNCYEGTNIFTRMNEQNKLVRLLVIYCELLLILFFGKVGNSAFIYFQF